MFRTGPRVRAVRPTLAAAALAVANRDPHVNALPGARLTELGRTPQVSREFSILGNDANALGALWHGVNLSPMSCSPEALTRFANDVAGRDRSCASIVGPRRDIEAMWDVLEAVWGDEVREYRWSQLLLQADGSAAAPPPDSTVGLRPATTADADAVYPAAVAMFKEEVGVDPTAPDGGRGYLSRVRQLARTGRTYVVTDPHGAVIFKADVGAVFGTVAQIHGVWTDPEHRGEGIASRAMAQLVPLVQRDHAPEVTLYVNDFNDSARKAYQRAGFRPIGELSTILF